MTLPAAELSKLTRALPFAISLALIPLAWIGAFYGGWTVVLLPLVTWYMFSFLDAAIGLNTENGDLDATDDDLFWYSAITIAWVPLQFLTLFGMIWYVAPAEHLSSLEKVVLFFGVGVITGTVGINYSHELMHQKNKLERFMGDALLAMVLYSHFRSEHLLVHHRYVATPKDPVTARWNESFYRFYPRVLRQSLLSAWNAEKGMLARKDLPWSDRSNPFFKYWAMQGGCIGLAVILGGWTGLALFLIQASVAIWQLELVNYVEHYGLTRKHLGDGKYEHVHPHHSWNAAHKASNWLLINLQRHSDHHYKPDRRFPVLQNYTDAQAPQLPYGYPVMTVAAMFPPLWRKVMHPRVRKWREMYYPEITDWKPYNKAQNPLPR
ncbi:Alkane 1-monooxygenase 2 [Ascidiaceihabitans donghaensis]|uniref:Alkane 1-monooxygenase 2 n=1 Tax=Ascidiaceihabitans donghaensis TaxID=1510460 RepID=A0A2R8BIP1_9RHOB|nr:alkane 1-monooxygenase [Ascidiaceihabitans donghaensis]SPH22996.1 Alkane 1-monooxygenase 2 [Ascidiaceihabitans donghaensis]